MNTHRRLGSLWPITLFAVAAIIGTLLSLTGCQTAAETAEPVLRELLAQGQITQEQFDRLMKALTTEEGFWETVGQIGGIAATVILSALGITSRGRGAVAAAFRRQPAKPK